MGHRVVLNRAVALSIAISAALLALTVSGVFATTTGATETRFLTSSADTHILESAPKKNYGTVTSLGVGGDEPAGTGKDQSALLKWSLSTIPAGSKISSASVTLNVTNTSTQTYQAYELKQLWVESAATWQLYATGKSWQTAGAKGSLDRGTTVVGSVSPSTTGKQTFALSSALVQGWVDNPASNNGIIIASATNTDGFAFSSRETSTSSLRPQLTLNLSLDTTPPETTIDSGPSGTVSSSSTSFAFSSSEPNATFECSLDGGAYSACTSPKGYTNLSDGSHTFSVRAKDQAGNVDQSPASYTWTIDTVAPNTTIDSQPNNSSNNASPSFSFSSNEANSTFECKLDGSTYASCTSPKSYTNLSDGSHTFSVRATDAASNTDATPASYTWTVDTVAPNVSIDSGPSGAVSNTSASFTFSSNDQSATFQCSLDGDAFASCSSPMSYTGLSDGSHTFQVRATDAAANTDPIPASRTWTVDTTAPDTTIDSGPSGTISVAEATFEFSSEAGASFECRLDGTAYSACTSPKSYTNLTNGSHTFDVRATDGAGNVDATPASGTFSVDAPLPPDTTPPESAIDSGPSGTVSTSSASFTFSSSEDGSTFECSLDGSAFEPCSSPQSYTDLSEGSHTLEVKATDQASNTDPTPASRIWTVDTTPPETTIDSGPADGATLSSGDPSFTFSSSEAGSTFECSLDSAAYTACTSPKEYTDLSEGSHTFEVRATDWAGNVDPTPAVLHYSVEVPPPDTDGDMIPDSLDNCPTVANATQADADGDGTGDACDSQDNRDTDGDGLQNWQDTCPDEAGPSSNDGCPITTIRENVVDYGATPNDSTNDTNAFKSAMDATGVGEVTYVPSGAFRVANLNIPSNTDVEIESSAVIKKFGTTAGPLFRERGPTNTTFAENIHIEGVGGNFTLDTNDAGQETAGVVFQNVRDFSLKNAVCIQNNDNRTQQEPSSRRPCLSFLPTTSTPSGGAYNHPTNGLIENVHSLESPYGWGLVQTTGGESLTFTNISGEGGSVLRLENYSNGWTPMKNITATDVTCTDGHNAVMFNPHGASHLGGIHVRDVVADSCEEAVSITGDGTYGPDVSVDGVEAIPGSTAQVRDPDPGGYVGAWMIGDAPWCVVDRGTYPVSISNLSCGGLPNR